MKPFHYKHLHPFLEYYHQVWHCHGLWCPDMAICKSHHAVTSHNSPSHYHNFAQHTIVVTQLHTSLCCANTTLESTIHCQFTTTIHITPYHTKYNHACFCYFEQHTVTQHANILSQICRWSNKASHIPINCHTTPINLTSHVQFDCFYQFSNSHNTILSKLSTKRCYNNMTLNHCTNTTSHTTLLYLRNFTQHSIISINIKSW